jgi:serine/threonine-protein kinase Chk1
VASHVIRALNSLSVTHDVKPIGDDAHDSISLSPLDEEGEEDEEEELDENSDAMEVDVKPATDSKRKEVGSRGARIRVSTMDRRKCALRGEIWVESITFDGREEEEEEEDGKGLLDIIDEEEDSDAKPTISNRVKDKKKARTLVLMRRSKGDPLEWRRLFRAIATFDGVKELISTA